MISQIHSATIAVSDQDAALDFYVNKLGWKKSLDNQMGPDMRFVTVVPPGGSTELSLAHTSWVGDAATLGGQTGISMITPDIDATYKTLTERGVRFKEPVAVMPWGQKAAWFYDTDDNEFFLVEQQ